MRYHLRAQEYRVRPHTEFIVIHCSASPLLIDYTVQACRRDHIHLRGWDDIGYHFYIDQRGTLHLGRPFWAVGAHVAGSNSRAVGVCYEGGVDAQNRPRNTLTKPQEAAMVSVVTLLSALYPQAVVQGHRDFPGVAKACPSFDAKTWWKEVGV